MLGKSVAIMEDLISHDLRGIHISIIADAVWTNIEGGQSILFVYASSPELPGTGEILLGERKFLTHSAENQAQVIVDILRQYKIEQWQLMWFCGDNVATNRKTARLLQLPFANCLPHSLNLVLQKFLNNFKVTACMRYFDAIVSTDVTSPLPEEQRAENLKQVEKVIDGCRADLSYRLKAACDEVFQTRLESSGDMVKNWVHDAL